MGRSTGNWSDDLARDVRFFMGLGLVALFAIPVLLIAVVVLVILLVF